MKYTGTFKWVAENRLYDCDSSPVISVRRRTLFRWVSARKTQHQCVSNGATSFLRHRFELFRNRADGSGGHYLTYQYGNLSLVVQKLPPGDMSCLGKSQSQSRWKQAYFQTIHWYQLLSVDLKWWCHKFLVQPDALWSRRPFWMTSSTGIWNHGQSGTFGRKPSYGFSFNPLNYILIF